ncbi:Rv2253 family sensor-like surface protein [Mycolicibacterium thermoresistibile]
MTARRMCAALLMAGLVAAGVVSAPAVPVAEAAGHNWSGRYVMVSYASQKDGTSVAARQPEHDFSATYTFVTSCPGGVCVATAVQGPEPQNPSIPRPQRYTWDGSQWTFVYDWQWDCYRGDGVAKEWSPARSWASYTPQPDGSLRGMWHTDIAAGVCRGSVIMPVAAYPA